MKQGMTRKLKPKDKHTKASWKKRDEARKGLQESHKMALIGRAALEGDIDGTSDNS